MAMFLAEISFLLALALFAAGLVLWHRGREAAGLPRAAGAVLVVGAALSALCTVYFSARYQVQGEFDHAYPHPPAMAAPGTAGPGMMGPGMMGPGMMRPGTQDMPKRPGGPPAQMRPSETPPGDEEHHPDGDE